MRSACDGGTGCKVTEHHISDTVVLHHASQHFGSVLDFGRFCICRDYLCSNQVILLDLE